VCFLFVSISLAAALLLDSVPLARADIFTIDFENVPSLPAQPNNFSAAGAIQTYTQAGKFSISGGVVLGNPTFLSAFAAHGSAPNLYGTADFADPSLLDTIKLTFTPVEFVTNVSGVLFNGQPAVETYTLKAFAGLSLASSITFTNVQADSSPSDFRNFNLASLIGPITSVEINTPNSGANGWDFFVDTIIVTTAVPEPSSLLILVTVMAIMAGLVHYRLRRGSALDQAPE